MRKFYKIGFFVELGLIVLGLASYIYVYHSAIPSYEDLVMLAQTGAYTGPLTSDIFSKTGVLQGTIIDITPTSFMIQAEAPLSRDPASLSEVEVLSDNRTRYYAVVNTDPEAYNIALRQAQMHPNDPQYPVPVLQTRQSVARDILKVGSNVTVQSGDPVAGRAQIQALEVSVYPLE